MSLEDKIAKSMEIISNAFSEHEPVQVWGMLSGGYDSLVCTHLVAQSGLMDAATHLNTGIGIPQTRQYVRETCKDYGWTLKEYRADEYVRRDGTPDPQIYEDLVVNQGFPGPPHHQKMFDRLKGRALNQAVREHKKDIHDRIMLCTGVRRDESRRRSGIKDPVDRQGAKVWVNPILDWSKRDCREYMDRFDLPLSEVVELLCMSGECLCGAFAKPGELKKIESCYPEVANRIKSIQKKCPFPWGWEDRQPGWYAKLKRGESFLPGMEPSDLDESMLCHDCKAKRK